MNRFIQILILMISTSVMAEQPNPDPYESFNRKVYAFNDAIDQAVLRPLAVGYQNYTPSFFQRATHNFIQNLEEPWSMLNNLLQAKPEDSLISGLRFVINSTIGLLGLVDVASAVGISSRSEDLGQTLAVWGWEDSAFIMIPFYGPSSVRDFSGKVTDWSLNPTNAEAGIEAPTSYAKTTLDLVDTRARILSLDEMLSASPDPYLFMRSAYLERRRYLQYDGNPPKMTSQQEVDDMDFMLE